VVVVVVVAVVAVVAAVFDRMVVLRLFVITNIILQCVLDELVLALDVLLVPRVS
jgi:hypothetical protein